MTAQNIRLPDDSQGAQTDADEPNNNHSKHDSPPQKEPAGKRAYASRRESNVGREKASPSLWPPDDFTLSR